MDLLLKREGKSLADHAVLRRERVALTLTVLLVVALTSTPYLLGYLLARPDTTFTGLIMNPEDSQSYFAKMRQGYDGHWLYTIPFTPEEHPAAFVGGFYLALGHLARALNLTIELVWHLARLAANVILFLATFAFIAVFLREKRARWLAYLLALFGSGLGWLLFLFNQPYWLGAFPVDFKMPESHLFFTALTFPHVALGTALVLVTFRLVLKITETGSPGAGLKRRWLYAVLAGLVNLAIGITYPFLIYLVAATASLYWFCLVMQARRISWRSGALLVIGFLIPTPLYLYYAYTLQVNPVFRAWDTQAATPSPPWPHYLVAYGVMLILGFLPFVRNRRAQLNRFTFLWLWVAAVALLLYAPLNSQRRFIQGVQVPLAILAVVGLWQVVWPQIEASRFFQWLLCRPRYSAAGLQSLFIVIILAFMSLSHVYILASTAATAALVQPYPFFRPRAEVAAADWLQMNTPRSAVVLSEYVTGNYLAARAGNRVVVGHWAETLNWQGKMGEVARFYAAATPDNWRRELLARYDVSYVWFGPPERELGDFEPGATVYLQLVFENEAVRIYHVELPSLAAAGH